jgi:hypothetical protein
MIQLPRRSVTRFFIPMIDVLTLLFCLYLLMPVVSATGEAESDSVRREREERMRYLEAEAARKSRAGQDLTEKERAEIERLRKERIDALKERLAVRVLEIDGATGKLYYRGPDRIEVRDDADALKLIDRDRQAQGVEKRELFYLILYPRDPNSPYPTVRQRQDYDRWFAGVALGYDVPGRQPGRKS